MTEAGRRLDDSELGPALRRLRRSARLTRVLVLVASGLSAVVLAMPALFIRPLQSAGPGQVSLPLNWTAFIALGMVLALVFAFAANLLIRRHSRRLSAELERSDLLARVLGGWFDIEPLYEAAPALFRPGIRLAQLRSRGLAGELIMLASKLDWHLKYPEGGNPFRLELAAIWCMLASVLILPLVAALLTTVVTSSLGGSLDQLLFYLGLTLGCVALVGGLPLIPLMWQNVLSSAGLDALDEYLSAVLSGAD